MNAQSLGQLLENIRYGGKWCPCSDKMGSVASIGKIPKVVVREVGGGLVGKFEVMASLVHLMVGQLAGEQQALQPQTNTSQTPLTPGSASTNVRRAIYF
jgi:hypothetical protein